MGHDDSVGARPLDEVSLSPPGPARLYTWSLMPRNVHESAAVRLATMCASAVLLMTSAGCASVSARSRHPNFTGTWFFNSAKSRLEIPSPDSTIFIIDHQEPVVRVFRTHARAGTLDTATVTLRTDSSEIRMELRGAQITSRSWWEGRELVFWSALARGDQRASQVVRYSLSDDRRTFTAIETVDAGAASHVNRWIFDRRQ